MRRVNIASRQVHLGHRAYHTMLKWLLSKGVLPALGTSQPSVRLPVAYAPWVAARSEEAVKQLASAGVCVVGDPVDLLAEPSYSQDDSQRVDDASVLRAAVDGYVGFAQVVQEEADRVARERDRLQVERDKLGQELNRVEHAHAALARAEEARANHKQGVAGGSHRPARQALIDLSEGAGA